MATQGGPAKAVSVQTTGAVIGGPAVPVAVVTDGRAVEGAIAQPIQVVTSGPVQGGPALPVVAAASGARVAAGPPLKVYVVSGSFAPAPVAQTYTQKLIALSPIAYWPQAEPSGTTIVDESGNGRDGAYSNVVLGATGIGDGRTAATYVPGSTSRGNVFSASLQAAFNGAEGTVACWCRVSGAGVWADGQNRRVLVLQADASNNLLLTKTSGGLLNWTYIAGGTPLVRTKTITPTAWFHLALTWSKSNDRVIAYYNGVQEGATLTGLGTWAGSLAASTTVLGSTNSAGAFIWDGNLAHAAIWTSALSAAQIATLATV